MATTTDTAPDANLGAPVGDKAAYLESQQQTLPNYTKTLDASDDNIGASIHTEGGVTSPNGLGDNQPGQVFAPWQLPNPDAAIKAGLPVMTVPEHLIFDHDDAVTHLQGPDPLDVLNHELREKLGYPMLATSTGKVATDAEDGPRDVKGSGLPKAEVQEKAPDQSGK